MININIKSSLYFSYANELSEDYGLYNININPGLQQELVVPERALITTSIRGRSKPYLQGFNYNQRSIPISCQFIDNYNEEKIRSVLRWLCGQTYYQPLIFSEDPNKVYYALCDQQVDLVHNCLEQGYLNISFTCNDYFVYSPIYTVNKDYSGSSENIFEFMNGGDIDCYPKMTIEKVGQGDISIINLSNNGYEFRLSNLDNGEVVTVFNAERIIRSSIEGIYRYNSFNGQYMYFTYGKNTLKVMGQCRLKFDYELMFYS